MTDYSCHSPIQFCLFPAQCSITGVCAYGNRNPASQAYGGAYQSAVAQLGAGPFASPALLGAGFPGERKSLPTGTIFGELIGWRIWFSDGSLLRSIAQSFIWLPDHVAEGEVIDYGYAGIWAFKEAHRAWSKMREISTFCGPPGDLVVCGSVYMWGEVVEHEYGYRAQFAKIRSLDDILVITRGSSLWSTLKYQIDRRKILAEGLTELRRRYCDDRQ